MYFKFWQVWSSTSGPNFDMAKDLQSQNKICSRRTRLAGAEHDLQEQKLFFNRKKVLYYANYF